jgi:hypothetical protein
MQVDEARDVSHDVEEVGDKFGSVLLAGLKRIQGSSFCFA